MKHGRESCHVCLPGPKHNTRGRTRGRLPVCTSAHMPGTRYRLPFLLHVAYVCTLRLHVAYVCTLRLHVAYVCTLRLHGHQTAVAAVVHCAAAALRGSYALQSYKKWLQVLWTRKLPCHNVAHLTTEHEKKEALKNLKNGFKCSTLRLAGAAWSLPGRSNPETGAKESERLLVIPPACLSTYLCVLLVCAARVVCSCCVRPVRRTAGAQRSHPAAGCSSSW